jgi:hypothetical protein
MHTVGNEMPKWAENLAASGFRELVSARSHEPFFPPSSGVPVFILPFAQAGLVRVHVLYACKRALSPKVLTEATADQLIRDWRKYCRAFVEATLVPALTPRLTTATFDGTRRAKKELIELGGIMPTLGEMDEALGTSLQSAEARRFDRVRKLIDITH